jgi:hypothetical protein
MERAWTLLQRKPPARRRSGNRHLKSKGRPAGRPLHVAGPNSVHARSRYDIGKVAQDGEHDGIRNPLAASTPKLAWRAEGWTCG